VSLGPLEGAPRGCRLDFDCDFVALCGVGGEALAPEAGYTVGAGLYRRPAWAGRGPGFAPRVFGGGY
jgi:hypothetical protein